MGRVTVAKSDLAVTIVDGPMELIGGPLNGMRMAFPTKDDVRLFIVRQDNPGGEVENILVYRMAVRGHQLAAHDYVREIIYNFDQWASTHLSASPRATIEKFGDRLIPCKIEPDKPKG